MKNIILLFLIFTLLIFTGADCNKNNSNGNENTNEGYGSNNDFPEFELNEDEELTEIGGGLYVINNPSESDSQSDALENTDVEEDTGNEITDEEWEDIEATEIISEHYISGYASGATMNMASYMDPINADVYGYFAILSDGAIRGKGTLNYASDNSDCIMNDPTGGTDCRNDGLQNGTFRIYGNVVNYQDIYCDAENDWIGGNYWLDLMFIVEDQPTEQVIYINTHTGGEAPAENYNLHLLLHGSGGPFANNILTCPRMYSPYTLNINNNVAAGTLRLEFVDDLGQEYFQELRTKTREFIESLK